VLCRLSIQIFSRPELILKELHRILKPGGRLYLIGEDYDLIVGYPNDEDIHAVYDAAGKYGRPSAADCTTASFTPSERPAPGQHPVGLP
jgi:SAM-dependent methyltransferase